MKPEVSVIIPTHNRRILLLRAVNSVLTQKNVTFEVIVVDDGSNDATCELFDQWNDPRIHYFSFEKSRGAQAARNFGITKAKADLITFLDSDDIFLEQNLSARVAFFKGNPDCECSYSDFEVLFAGKEKNYVKEVSFKPDHSDSKYANVLKRLALAPMIVFMARKNVLQELGGMDLSLPASHDDDIYLRFSKRGKVYHIPVKSARIMVGSGDSITSDTRRVAFGRSMLVDKYREDILALAGSRTLGRQLISISVEFLLARDLKLCKENFSDAQNYIKFPYFIWFYFLMYKLCLKLFRFTRRLFFDLFY
jgi:glycosyltransferase involved in cell wall biosynthesis